jgi:hypothetical protein
MRKTTLGGIVSAIGARRCARLDPYVGRLQSRQQHRSHEPLIGYHSAV